MDNHQLRMLKSVVTTGSFTKAATQLGYTQSTVSQLVRNLETELGFKVLKRARSGVVLTQEGKALWPTVQRALLQFENVAEKAAEINGADTGTIRVGTVSSITCHWLPPLIKRFKTTHPNVHFAFFQGDYNSIQDWIQSGDVDFGFTSTDIRPKEQTIQLKRDEMVLITAKQHRLATQATVRPIEIGQEPFILLEEGYYNEALQLFKQAQITPNIQYRLHDDYAIMTMVEQNLGVSILPKLVLNRTHFDICTHSLAPQLTRDIALGFLDWASLPISSRKFIELIQQEVAQLP